MLKWQYSVKGFDARQCRMQKCQLYLTLLFEGNRKTSCNGFVLVHTQQCCIAIPATVTGCQNIELKYELF